MPSIMTGTSTATTAATMNTGSEAATPVYVTRDCMHFRPLPRTPLASIASRLFALLRGSSQASMSARRAFAHCIVDHALPLPTSSHYSQEIDNQIKDLFSINTSSGGGPVIVCVQGPLKVDFLHAQTPNPGQARSIISPSARNKSIASINNTSTSAGHPNGNSSTTICLHDSIFFGFTLHNELTRCAREDPDQYGRFCFFYLCALVHETAHWILTKIHGFRSDSFRHEAATSSSINGKIGPANISVSQAGQSKPDYLIAIGQRPDDAGARATDMLIGATSKVVSFADGDTDIVRRGFSPRIIEEPPILSQAAFLEVMGLKSMPKMEDVTGEAPILIGGPIPKWSTHDNYLVTSQTLVNSYCAHGVTRIGQLFN